ncbi:ATP-binding protein [Saccharopolyspora soli]|uniref:ATP-binding protein n=1 Tax=Saccharopolyspora soli TaxID=2926618 RepID=UPI001F5A3D6C|nr:NB-ARC domain-containing protein [Saccharopolyspora soli]
MLRFVAIAVFAGAGAYLSLFSESDALSTETRIVLGVVAALVVGLLTSIQVVLSLEARGTAMNASSRRPTLNQLPRDLLDFTGRSHEVGLLSRTLVRAPKSGKAVLVTAISGQGGIGKTALAIHVAHQVAYSFPDGQIYVNLRGPEAEALDPYEVLGALLRELGVAPDAVPISLDDRSRLFRSILGRRHILILLDNAQSEAQVQPLLPGESTSVVLITSRARLAAVDGITRLRLDVMAQDESIELLREIVGRERIDREADATKKLVELASYLPLAIRILGARLAANTHWSVHELVQRLLKQQTLLPELSNGKRAIRSTLEISYVALSEQASLLFASLGALNIKTFPDWIFELLDTDELHATRTSHGELLEQELAEFLGPDPIGSSRYGYHDLLREFSQEKLAARPDSAAVTAATLEKVGGAYAATARAADSWIRHGAPRHNIFPALRLPDDQQPSAVALDSTAKATLWCETELPSLLLITNQMLLDGHLEHVTTLAFSLSAFCEERSYWREWESLAKCGMSAASALDDAAAHSLFLFQLGRVHHLLGAWSDSMSEFEQAHALANQHGLRSIEAACLCAIGKVHQLGTHDATIPFFEQARAIYAEISDDHAWAYVTANLADIYHLKLESHRSLREFDLCMPIFRRHGDDWWEANAGIWIGDVHRDLEDYATAIAQLDASLATMRRLGDQRRAAVALVHLARAHADSGDGHSAMGALGTAIPVLDRVSDRWWKAMAMIEMGKAQWLLRKPAEALASWNQALSVVKERKNSNILNDLMPRVEAAKSALGHSHGKRGS